MINIGFIGIGNMGSAMVKGLINISDDIQTYAYDIDNSRTSKFKKEKVKVVSSTKEILEKSKYVVLSIKPKLYNEMFIQIRPYITKEHVIITIAPGYSIEKAKKLLGQKTKIVRAMPNTPALVNEGMTAYCYDDNEITKQSNKEIEYMFSSFGKCIKVDECDMEAIIATTGSSPAYGYIFIEAMADAAVSFGIDRDVAYELAAQSLKGSAQMVLDSKKHPGQLKDEVSSPGGTTIAAVLKLEETQFRNSIIKAMSACYEKALDMNL